MKQPPPLHILLVGPAHTVHVQRWIKGLSDKGMRISLLTEAEMLDPLPAVKTYLLPGKRLPRILRYCLGAICLPILAMKAQPDVIHLQSIGMNGLLGLLPPSRLLVLSPWGSDVAVLRKGTLRFSLVSLVTRRANRILTTSEAMKKKIVDLFGVASSNIDVISWGVDTDTFHPVEHEEEREDERARWGLPLGRLIITSSRTIGANYRTHELVKAFVEAQGALGSSHLVLVRGFTPGNNQARKDQEQYIQQLRQLLSPVQDKVTLLEQPVPTEEMASLLRASDIVVSVPRTDQRSSSALEAIATGAKVVLSDIPPNREIASEGAVVSLVGEPFEQNLLEALLDENRLDENSLAKNLAFIERHESWSSQLDRILNVYSDIKKHS